MSSLINPTTLFHSNLTTALSKQPPRSGDPLPSNHTRRKTISTLLISTSFPALVGGASSALAAEEQQKWGTRSFLWEHFFEAGLSPEDSAARIKNTAEGLHGLRHMVETMSWRYLIFYIRLKSAYLKQDMKAALSTVPLSRRRDYVDTANELIDNMAEFDYYVRTPKLIESSSVIHRKIPCGCGRRCFIEAIGTYALIPALFPSACSSAPIPESSKDVLSKFHPPKPDWYEELYASILNNSMKSYEAEVASYKSQLFDKMRGKVKDIVEIGIGTGPNLKFYASEAGVNVIGVDPNNKMEKYARASAEATELPSANFQFVQAVGEVLPLADTSVDAVIGTLVLCSVNDVSMTLKEIKRVLRPGGYYLFLEHVGAKDGTLLRFSQNVLNPLQKLLSDGCNLTRETGNYIAEAGFSELDSKIVFVKNASLINPQIYGIARK